MNCSDNDFKVLQKKDLNFVNIFLKFQRKKSFWTINSKNNFLSGNLSAELTYYSMKEAVT